MRNNRRRRTASSLGSPRLVFDETDRSVWRRNGRRRVRSQRLTLRGRITLSAFALCLLAPLGFAAASWLPSLASSSPAGVSPPAVSSGPPGSTQATLAHRGADLDRRVPAAILGRVPSFSAEYVTRVAEAGEVLAEEVGSAIGPLSIEYAFDPELLRRTERVLRKDRAPRAHVLAMDVETGRVLVFASSDPALLSPTRAYPAASLVKVVTAAGAIDYAPTRARQPCHFRGSPYRLTRARLAPPERGNRVSLGRALATSNNQCFAHLAVHTLGAERMLGALRRFGWLEPPAPGHDAGTADAGDDDYSLGKLGCGLAGSLITPLHALQLAASLASGELVEPWWIDQVLDTSGQMLALPDRGTWRRAMSPGLAREIRTMLVDTTKRGTARRGFRTRRGRPKLPGLAVAGKTGNLTAHDSSLPSGRYEWFIGVAPAEAPRIAIAVLQLQRELWWSTSSAIAADVLQEIFCDGGRCVASLADRYLPHSDSTSPALAAAPPDRAGRS